MPGGASNADFAPGKSTAAVAGLFEAGSGASPFQTSAHN
jgi:hypothetical protein